MLEGCIHKALRDTAARKWRAQDLNSGPQPRYVLCSQCWKDQSFLLIGEDFQSALDSCGNWEWGSLEGHKND